jgi:transketolase
MTTVTNRTDHSPQQHEMTTPTSMPLALKKQLTLVANAIRGLAIDAVHRAGSGHAGTPMGCAELGAYLYGHFLNYNAYNTHYVNRDRFILSAGHASMLQYACLHFNGILSINDLKQFRQLNSKTASHPQYRLTPGVETTTGVDGQGVAHGVGQALGIKLLGARFNRGLYKLYTSKVVVLAGDGCLMEGISHEACSLAGHLKVNNLILIYDQNKTCLDGFSAESCSEDTKKRYEAYGWEVYEVDGHDFDSIHAVFSKLRKEQTKPSLIIADTTIGKGAVTQAGSYFIHSGPLEQQEKEMTKEHLGLPSEKDFFVPPEVYDYFAQQSSKFVYQEADWRKMFDCWKQAYPDLFAEYQKMSAHWLPDDIEKKLSSIQIEESASGRAASGHVLNYLGDILPGLYGGSADLARSDMTHMHQHDVVTATQLQGRNIKYGVREFAMGGIAIGLAQTEMIRPFVGTFLAFSDYMLNAVRMAALMKLPIVYQFTHDSFYIGQDGPTHQPIEHLSHLRAIPNLQVIRPADANEVKMAWLAALKHDGPTALILSRQELSPCPGTERSFAEGVGRGAYIIKKGATKVDFTLIGTGSEVSLALQVSEILALRGYHARVVSMPCWELFDSQDEAYKEGLFGANSGIKVSIEAAAEIGWHKYVLDGKVISLNTFGKSATAKDLAQEFGFTSESIVEQILKPRSPKARL